MNDANLTDDEVKQIMRSAWAMSPAELVRAGFKRGIESSIPASSGASEAVALRMIFAHWNEFGPEHGFGELMDRLQE